MTCPNATAPVNIVNNPDFICDLKCEFSFNYSQTSLNIANRGDYLSLKPDPSNSPPVIYNVNKYDVTEMRIYQPSLHQYKGKHADAELIIIHGNVSSRGNLLVCVPIVKGTSTSNPDSSELLDTIISEVAKTANSPGTKTTVDIPTFSINNFIPVKPYYSYNGSLPYSPCNGEYDYVVFSKDNEAMLAISEIANNSLQKIITANSYSISKKNKDVFYNKNKPTNNTSESNGDGNLYIKCHPTGESGESLVPLKKTPEQLFNINSIKELFENSLFLSITIGLLIFIILIQGYSWLANKLTSGGNMGGGGYTATTFKNVSKYLKKRN